MTSERYQKIKATLQRRQPDLTVVMENVNKAHNLAAIARTCDAVGIPEIHATTRFDTLNLTQDAASGSGRWVNVVTHDNIDLACALLRSQKQQILTAHFSDDAVDFRTIDFTIPTAIVVGQELFGISEQALNNADKSIIIPMYGMVHSLNVSVATAIILYEAQRQRNVKGMYNAASSNNKEMNNYIFEKGYPRLARMYRKDGKEFPHLDEEGQIIVES